MEIPLVIVALILVGIGIVIILIDREERTALTWAGFCCLAVGLIIALVWAFASID